MRRFSLYSFAVLGYRITNKWRRTKEKYLGQAVPYVGFTPANGGAPPTWKKGKNTDKMMDAAKRGTRVESAAKGRNLAIRIFVPFGHPIPSDHSAAFRRIPGHELGAVSGAIARALAHFLSYGIDKVSDVKTGEVTARTIVGASSTLSRGLGGGGRSIDPDIGPRRVG